MNRCPCCGRLVRDKTTTKRNREIRQRVAEGQLPKAVAIDMGISASTVYRATGSLRSKTHKSAEDVKAVVSRVMDGESPTRLARELGVNRTTIYRWKEEHART